MVRLLVRVLRSMLQERARANMVKEIIIVVYRVSVLNEILVIYLKYP